MKVSKNKIKPIMIIMLVTATIIIVRSSFNHNRLQKKIDYIFENSIIESLDGLSKDYGKLDKKDQARYYYMVLDNLKDALNVFHETTYRDNEELYNTIQRIYTNLLVNQDRNYTIDNQGLLYEYLSKIIVYPEDHQLLEEFNQLLDEGKVY